MEKEKKLKGNTMEMLLINTNTDMIGDNVEIAKSAADHVNELMAEIIDLKTTQEKYYQKRIDLGNNNNNVITCNIIIYN
jgi:hypothetical protein